MKMIFLATVAVVAVVDTPEDIKNRMIYCIGRLESSCGFLRPISMVMFLKTVTALPRVPPRVTRTRG